MSGWLSIAYGYLGVAEIPGSDTAPIIRRWLIRLRAWWSDDETPWCGTFVAQCIEAAGLPIPKYWMRAKAWADWGTKLSNPELGCIVVFERKGGGHVGFVVGRTPNGNLLVLGGNQGDKVCIAPFDRTRLIGYYWPPCVSLPTPQGLVVMAATGPTSTNEA